MKKQCPHCEYFKLRSVAKTATLVGFVALLFIITIPAAFLCFGIAIAHRGRYQCGNCGWSGKL